LVISRTQRLIHHCVSVAFNPRLFDGAFATLAQPERTSS